MKRFPLIVFASILIFSMQSCSVGGFLVGSIMDNNDDKDYSIPIEQGGGWITPSSNNYNVRLLLDNGKSIEGEYKGMKTISQGENLAKVVNVKAQKTLKNIPVKMVAHTKIYHKKKDYSSSGFKSGLVVDLVIVALVAASGGLSFSTIFS